MVSKIIQSPTFSSSTHYFFKMQNIRDERWKKKRWIEIALLAAY